MIPVQAPPIIPDKSTLELIIGPYGALALMGIMLSVAGWFIWRLVGRQDTMQAASDKLREESGEKMLAQQREYSEKLLTLHKEYADKLTSINERMIKGDMDSIAAARELTAEIRGLSGQIRTALKLP